MKATRWLVIGLASLLLSGSAFAETSQEVRGSVRVPMPGRIGPVLVEGCPGVVAGTVRWATGLTYTFHFPVNPATRGLAFALTPAQIASDLDITFVGPSPAGWVRFDTPALGGENGIVPPNATEAFVCLSMGAPTSFVYRAGSTPVAVGTTGTVRAVFG